VRNHVKFRDRHLQHANALIDSHSGHDAKPTVSASSTVGAVGGHARRKPPVGWP
jgi:hypothetical protein